jgi:hypothetical protein
MHTEGIRRRNVGLERERNPYETKGRPGVD